ncbi:ABC transporter ATP-binding protein/permease [Dermabacter hominis]|uniref:ABC transporter ATP-binding protein n=1 Tax=Dermabacter hominis TaxID=36740 RepID=UPI0021A73B4F|nr:ABC transporter ATP-binding protein [Dermabacter hominis]MCT2056362.1 ABC transporter ATP-binding protein/permease [Dermabacter hominis]MCT2084040.1 ABC transporter ATP-binding protein/permease [Dermabacter hominis]MCT2091454.1 ABC transporter ATP-binding protein/permease [Dermabacter hominis]MCT2190971.1 ABC transporter ATP-binding protein/permease [Dermabacter hominis]MCT2227460.1 ABC transporter ATP-binding protein/permease [Dermabacter hominis]
MSWFSLVLVVMFEAAAQLAALYLPTLNADIIDLGIAKGDIDAIWRLAGWMLLVSFANILALCAANYFAGRVAMRLARDVRSDVFDRVQSFSAKEISHFTPASLITRNTNDVQQLQNLSFFGLMFLVSAPITGIGGAVLALQQEAQLAWLIAVMVPLMLIAIGVIVLRAAPLFREMQERIDELNLILREQITGIRVVRAFVREPYERDRFEVSNERFTQINRRVGHLIAFINPIIMFLLSFSSVLVLLAAAGPIDRGEMQVGSIVAFISYLIQILIAVMMATFMTMMIPRAMVSAERITEVLDTHTSVALPAPEVAVQPGDPRVSERAELEFDDVTFAYPGAERPVLEGISFKAHAGQTVAIIGGTGSGKTTLLGLISRLFDVTDGAVKVNGVDVREAAPELLHGRLGYVPQRPYLFSGTVASNVRFGRPEASDEEVWHALTIAQARDFVAEMPEGLDSPIAQGGSNVSGGQRQRLSIARALLSKPDIYLFDDSFSALDLQTDARLRSALKPETREALMVIVAQRVSTITNADLILVLDHGRIVGRGTHEELLATNETYQEIVASQGAASEFEEEAKQ